MLPRCFFAAAMNCVAVTTAWPLVLLFYLRQQNSSEYAHASGGPIPLHVAFAEYRHIPPPSPALTQAGSVSAVGGPQKAAWHLPARQTAPLSQGQPQPVPGSLVANAWSKAVVYCAMALLLIPAVVQPSQAKAGHEETSPTATQSVSTMQDWS